MEVIRCLLSNEKLWKSVSVHDLVHVSAIPVMLACCVIIVLHVLYTIAAMHACTVAVVRACTLAVKKVFAIRMVHA